MLVADVDLVADVLSKTEVLSCFPDDLPHDPVIFRQACIEAAENVPFTIHSFNKSKFVTRRIEARLQDAIVYRNKWYRDQLRANAVNVQLPQFVKHK